MHQRSLPSLVTFGSLASWPSTDQLRDYRKAVISERTLSPIIETLKRLPAFWDTLASTDGSLLGIAGRASADRLAEWITSGEGLSGEDTPPSAIAMPMTIIAHLCQYNDYIQRGEEDGLSHGLLLGHVAQKGGVQGFCAGLLSALAIAGAADTHTIGQCGALAVSLAFAVGANVDLDMLTSGETKCLAVRWKTSAGLEELDDVIEKYDETYISAVRDAHDATLTVPQGILPKVSEELSARGMTVLATGLRGRYHSSKYQGFEAVDKIIKACDTFFGRKVSFGNQQGLVRSNADGQPIGTEDAVSTALACILIERSNWQTVLAPLMTVLRGSTGEEVRILSVGADSVPLSLAKGAQVVKAAALFHDDAQQYQYPDHAIAVIGMSCKLPGADSIDEFWQLLSGGTAMVEHVPSGRFAGLDFKRGLSAKGRFWGNFIRDIDAFDHRFFGKSSREAASMDPQQRLLLQAAYEAMESSGYFFADPSTQSKDIGCYIGLCATDYDANVASHAPNAFSTLGTLRAFLSGKISHFFGWSGPSLTIDTACSSSAVAIHTASQAIISGECSQAVAGGVALFTHPYLYENLGAAHFLSPTGATKPFDAKADGYCRGEGLGLVVLKKLSAAVADGDDILGVLAGSAVNQNLNCVPITVPHQDSQGELYEKVAKMAGISPKDVSFVEAHGTGTPVGDPIEIESIRRVFGGSQRRTPLFVSSVKGNIGHLEGASGVAGLIKAILQIENRTACIQASYTSLNPKIPALEPDRLVVPTANMTLPNGLLSACVNNYGAAGSNAAMMLVEYPRRNKAGSIQPTAKKYPFRILANSPASLAQYVDTLRDYIFKCTKDDCLLPSLAFSLGRRQNDKLPYSFETVASSTAELTESLRRARTFTFEQRPKSVPPLVLVFGGQTRSHVGLSKELWEQSALLRYHLDQCDETLVSLGYPSIYPDIFHRESIQDVVVLHSAIVSLQYATAKAWIDSGLKVDVVLGHSIGQLAALTVSGTLSLKDGLTFVAGRARLMQQHWGFESGSMISIEADIDTISTIPHQLELACYNGKASHVMVGEKAAVDVFEEAVSQKGLRYKRLDVVRGFHSKFTEPLIPHLEELARSLSFRDPVIHVETCSPGQRWPQATSALLAEHTRAPVFFHQAIQRVESSLGGCTFLEAGSDSGVLGMVRRIVDQSSQKSTQTFQPIALNKPNSADLVAEATVNLWKRGHTLRFWDWHRLQSSQLDVLRLPSYQFEKNRHWLELVAPVAPAAPKTETSVPAVTVAPVQEPELPPTLVSMAEHQPGGKAVFRINPRCGEYHEFVSGHVVAGSALCPATVYMEVAARAAHELARTDGQSNQLVSFQRLQIESPLGLATDRELNVELQSCGHHSWSFVVTSKPKRGSETTVSHCLGIVRLDAEKDGYQEIQQEFGRFERLTGPDRIEALYQDPESESIRGAMLYKVFSRVVEYAECYRGLRSVSAKNSLIGGLVAMPEKSDKETLTLPPTMDSFMQVAGIHANSIFPCGEADVYVFTKLDRLQFGPGFRGSLEKRRPAWRVFSNLTPSAPANKELSNDIFVFDSETNELVVLILGARFTNVRLASLTKVLSRVNETSSAPVATRQIAPPLVPQPPVAKAVTISAAPKVEKVVVQEVPAVRDNSAAIFEDVSVIVERVAEVPRADIKGTASFDDIGVDSLMMMEVISEISDHFSLELPVQDLEMLTDFNSLVQYLNKRLGSVGHAVPLAIQSGPASSSGSSDDLDSNSPPSSVSPTQGETYEPKSSPLEIFLRLGALVQEHLELNEQPGLDANLADLGLDSLLCIELASDIEKLFSVSIDMYQLNETSTMADLVRLVEPSALRVTPHAPVQPPQHVAKETYTPVDQQLREASLANAQQAFEDTRLDFDKFSLEQGFTGFWKNVYPTQANLVLSYIGEAFKKLGVDLSTLRSNQPVPPLRGVLPKHKQLIERLHRILADGGCLSSSTGVYTRTSTPYNLAPSQILLSEIITAFPLHASEHRLLNVTGSRLAECLTGKVDPLQILFANKANRLLLADVYDKAPMCQAATRHLASYLETIFRQSSSASSEPFRLLEVGGGTGGTTKFVVDFLTRHNIPFEYTFTDISSALVSSAKKSFDATLHGAENLRYAVVDVERPPAEEHCEKYHVIISTNCVHASRDATKSLANLRMMLRPEDGFLALVEFTNGMYWFDLVYGLLDGWWLFDDGRKHALADEAFWDRSLRGAGYGHVSWTDGREVESRSLRLICAWAGDKEKGLVVSAGAGGEMSKRAGIEVETVGSSALSACSW